MQTTLFFKADVFRYSQRKLEIWARDHLLFCRRGAEWMHAWVSESLHGASHSKEKTSETRAQCSRGVSVSGIKPETCRYSCDCAIYWVNRKLSHSVDPNLLHRKRSTFPGFSLLFVWKQPCVCVCLPPLWGRVVCMEQRESAAALLESVREQEVQFEQLTRALEDERRRVGLPATSPSALGHLLPHTQVTLPNKHPVRSVSSALTSLLPVITSKSLITFFFPSIHLIPSAACSLFPAPGQSASVCLWPHWSSFTPWRCVAEVCQATQFFPRT